LRGVVTGAPTVAGVQEVRVVVKGGYIPIPSWCGPASRCGPVLRDERGLLGARRVRGLRHRCPLPPFQTTASSSHPRGGRIPLPLRHEMLKGSSWWSPRTADRRPSSSRTSSMSKARIVYIEGMTAPRARHGPGGAGSPAASSRRGQLRHRKGAVDYDDAQTNVAELIKTVRARLRLRPSRGDVHRRAAAYASSVAPLEHALL